MRSPSTTIAASWCTVRAGSEVTTVVSRMAMGMVPVTIPHDTPRRGGLPGFVGAFLGRAVLGQRRIALLGTPVVRRAFAGVGAGRRRLPGIHGRGLLVTAGFRRAAWLGA